MSRSELFQSIGKNLQPGRPIRSFEFLRGRDPEFRSTVRELEHFDSIPFLDREHVYVACAPGSNMLQIFREIGEGLLALAIQFGVSSAVQKKFEYQLSLNPYIKQSIETAKPKLENFRDVNEAVRTLKTLDSILPNARQTVVVLDELEELNEDDRNSLSFLIKQLGDQEFEFVLCLLELPKTSKS